MKTVLHKASSRGLANHGWLNSYHTFSFADYYNPERMNFGVLRVLNDDTVAGGMGFDTHQHNNMEIVSIPLLGDLAHKDSMGNEQVIRDGDIQVMSAGTGIRHSEYNFNENKEVKFLQIWVIPNQQNVTPRYQQMKIPMAGETNRLIPLIAPQGTSDNTLWIHQQAWFSLGSFSKGKIFDYSINDKNNGAYLFVIKGSFKIGTFQLGLRDGLGVWETDKLSIEAESDDSLLLIMDVPMK